MHGMNLCSGLMKRVWLVLLLGSCVTPHNFSKAFVPADVKIEGPRALTLTGQDDDVGVLALALEGVGFEIEYGDVGFPARTKYVLHVEGVCGITAPIVVKPTLLVEVFDVATRQRVFDARPDDLGGCPRKFLREVAVELSLAWQGKAPEVQSVQE